MYNLYKFYIKMTGEKFLLLKKPQRTLKESKCQDLVNYPKNQGHKELKYTL